MDDLISKQDKRAVVKLIDNMNAMSFYEANERSKECYYDIRNAILAMPEQEPCEDAISRSEELQEIRREIDCVHPRFRDPDYVSGYVETIGEVLAIIDKHISESEEQE